MFERLFGKFSKDLGIDLGTSATRILQTDKGIVIDAPTVVSINNRTDQIIAVGHEARDMTGKIPPYITTYRPLTRGVISDYEITEKLLRHCINRVHESGGSLVPRPRVIIGVPLQTTEVERKAVEDVVYSSGAREVILVEDIMAAAIGCRLPIEESVGSMIVDIGAGKVEAAVISLSGIVQWKSTPRAGDEMNKALIQYVKETCDVLLGDIQAENAKIQLASAIPQIETVRMQVRGRDILSGLPKEIVLTDTHVRDAIEKILNAIIQIVKETLEVTPPELVADIHERGIVLCGGGALLRSISERISRETEISVRVTDDPLTATVRGMGVLFENVQPLSTLKLPSTRETV